MTRVVCWNIAKRNAPWDELLTIDADVALLQEAGSPPSELPADVKLGPAAHYDSHVWTGRPRLRASRWPMVVKLSDRVEVEWFRQVSAISGVACNEIAVSGIGTIAAARVVPRDAPPFIAFSMYARWIKPHPSTESKWRVGYADGSAHRIISDLSAFIGSHDPTAHRLLAAGDLNIVRKAKDDDRYPMSGRDHTVFARMQALGLEFMGPQYPHGRRVDPPSTGVPPDTCNVPTYYTTRESPATAKKQLDYVFASRGFHEQVSVRALNGVDEWGPSDHCRLQIDVADAPA